MLVQLLEGQTRIEGEVKKNSIKLEALEKNINVIAEVQTSHKGNQQRSLISWMYL